MRKDLVSVVKEHNYKREKLWKRKPKIAKKIHSNHYNDDNPGEVDGLKDWTSKWPSINYKTLEKVLRKEIGRPWSKVYQELCALNKGTDLIAKTFTDAINRIVSNTIEMNGKTPLELVKWSRYKFEREGFYVHPTTGLLCYNKPKKRVRNKKPITKINLTDGSAFELIEGCWYKTKIEQWREERFIYIYDMSSYNLDKEKERHKRLGTWETRKLGEGYRYYVNREKYTKKSCNKEELQQIKDYLKKV